MKLISATGILLLSSNVSVVFGSRIRGGDMEKEQERNLAVSLKSPTSHLFTKSIHS